MSGWLPDPSPTTLIPPNRDHPFFNFAGERPFEHAADGFSTVNAAWLADLSLLAYDDPVHVERALTVAGMHPYGRQPVVQDDGAGAAQVYVAYDQHTVLVAFRGTEIPVANDARGFLHKTFDSVQDLLANTRIALEPVADGAHAHRGFAQALDGVWDLLVEGWIGPLADSPERRRVWFTGHSLGGALATLAAWRYGRTAGVYTFGAPRVGDAALAAALAATPLWRVVLKHDLVTRVPPSNADGRITWVPAGYQHGGQLVHVDTGGAVHHALDDEELSERVLALAAGLGTPVRSLRQHFGTLVDSLLSGEAGNELRGLARSVYDHAPLYYALTMRHLLDRAG